MSVITRTIEGLDEASNLSAAYRVIWRWHFYAGLFCLPLERRLGFDASRCHLLHHAAL